MNPTSYISDIYTKSGSIKELEKEDEGWVPLYLNKVLIHERKNADAISMCIPYCLYISSDSYYKLLYCVIPKNLGYEKFYPKKKVKEEEEDKLITKIREVLGWSKREYDTFENIIKKEILNDRQYWESQLGI